MAVTATISPYLDAIREELMARPSHSFAPDRDLPPAPARHADAGCQLGGGAGDPRGAQVLNPRDQACRVQLQAALDEQLLHERVADLHAGPLGALAVAAERRTGQHRRAADAIRPGSGAQQDHLVPGSAGP